MLTVAKILGLLLFVIVIGYVTFFLVLAAIGLAFYSFATFRISVLILVGFVVASIGGAWLARIMQKVPMVAIALSVLSLAASIGIVVLALTATTTFLSGTEKQLLSAGIAIAFTLLALGMTSFSGWRSLLQTKNWLKLNTL
jgi:hypothetical protein